jgi:hypothetical protein
MGGERKAKGQKGEHGGSSEYISSTWAGRPTCGISIDAICPRDTEQLQVSHISFKQINAPLTVHMFETALCASKALRPVRVVVISELKRADMNSELKGARYMVTCQTGIMCFHRNRPQAASQHSNRRTSGCLMAPSDRAAGGGMPSICGHGPRQA